MAPHACWKNTMALRGKGFPCQDCVDGRIEWLSFLHSLHLWPAVNIINCILNAASLSTWICFISAFLFPWEREEQRYEPNRKAHPNRMTGRGMTYQYLAASSWLISGWGQRADQNVLPNYWKFSVWQSCANLKTDPTLQGSPGGTPSSSLPLTHSAARPRPLLPYHWIWLTAARANGTFERMLRNPPHMCADASHSCSDLCMRWILCAPLVTHCLFG